jgi:methylphosphotriester-DNA--protein-cysteine methyltransferase
MSLRRQGRTRLTQVAPLVYPPHRGVPENAGVALLMRCQAGHRESQLVVTRGTCGTAASGPIPADRAATGLPPHQYVIARRAGRAKQLLQGELSLAEVAAYAGFPAQSQFSYHFKGLLGVTPGQFRMPARIA